MGIQQALFMVGSTGSVSTAWNGLTFGDISLNAVPVLAAVELFVSTDGRLRVVTRGSTGGAGGTETVYNWFTPTTGSIGLNYWVRATPTVLAGVGPSTGSDATGTWLQINIERGWYAQSGSPNGNSQEFELLLQFSTTSDGSNIVSSGTVTLSAENSV